MQKTKRAYRTIKNPAVVSEKFTIKDVQKAVKKYQEKMKEYRL